MLGNNMLISLVFQAINKTSSAFSQINGEFKKLDATVKAVSKRFEHLNDIGNKMMMAGAGMTVSGAGLAYSLSKPIKAFTDLEDAATQLEVTMMEKGGKVSTTFSGLAKEAIALGNKLPGTTSDFYRLAAVMKALGASDQFLLGGGLRAASYLGVVLKPLGVSYEQAGEAAAKFKLAMGISEREMMPFMDMIQRTAFLGVKLEEMHFAFSKASGALKPLGIQGLKAAKELTPIFAMLIQAGGSGETVGTGVGRLINTVMDVQKIAKVNKSLGLDLKFTDKQGNFAGITNLVDQLDKLRALSQAQKVAAGKAIFGEGEDYKIAMTIMSEGRKGYDEYLKKMERQANLNERVEKSLGTLTNAWEAFTGTLQNAFAAMGKAMAPELKGMSKWLNDLSDKLYAFTERHQTLTKIIGFTVGGLGVALVGFGAFAVTTGAVLKSVRIVATGFKGLRTVFGLLKLAFGPLLGVIKSLSIALFTTPIGWIILGIMALVAAGYLLYRNWDKVSKALSAAWAWLKERWQKLWQGIGQWIQVAWYTVRGYILLMEMKVVGWAAKLIQFFKKISLFNIGKNIIESLWKGMKATGQKAIDAAIEIGSKIASGVKGVLGIKSPSTVFINVGRMISKGTEIGIGSGLPGLNAAARVMTRAAIAPVMGGIIPSTQPIRQVLEPVKAMATPLTQPILRPRTSGASSNGSNVTSLTYNPTVNIYGTSPSAKEDFEKMLDKHKDKIKQILEAMNAREARLAY